MFVSVHTLAVTGLRSALPVVALVVAVAAFFLYGACGCAGEVGPVADPAAGELDVDVPDSGAGTDDTGRGRPGVVLEPDGGAPAGDAVADDVPASSDTASPSSDAASPTDTSDAPDAPAADAASPDARDAIPPPDACPTHSNGGPAPIGQSYGYCAPLGVPGDASTYSRPMAEAAAGAWPEPDSPTAHGCGAGVECVVKSGAAGCATWCYSGALAGRVYVAAACWCPLPTDPTWN